MNRVIKTLGWTLLIGLLASIALVIALASSYTPWDASMITIADAPLALAQFDVGHWVLTAGGVALALVIALVVVLLVVPVAVVVPLAVAALVLVVAVVVVAGVAALAFSPLLLAAGVVWLIWRLVRGDRRKTGATIAG